MPLTRPLQRNIRREAQTTFNAAGQATVTIGPVPPGPAWEIKQITIKCTGNTANSNATTFVGTNSAGVRISGTLTGNDDTDSWPNTTVRYGESVCCVWTLGTNGALARMTVIYDEVGY